MIKYITTILFLNMIFLISCESPQDLNRPGDKLDGYIVHVDMNLDTIGGFYSVSVYSADSVNPFSRVPVRTDSMTLTRRDDLYESRYSMDGIAIGRYHIAATWSRYPRIPNEMPIVLGTYGCDTSFNCTDHTIVVYPNFQGNFRNFISWTDLGKRLN
jgi:hypothetical protein